MSGNSVATLVTKNPEEGLELAVRLARLTIKSMQPDAEMRKAQRLVYEKEPAQLIAASEVVAVHFRTIAAANNYWL